MGKKQETEFIVEETFISNTIEERINNVNEILYRLIKKQLEEE
ncbi:MAG: hypothetical protein WDA59_08845 [Methanofastidiosum sp.]